MTAWERRIFRLMIALGTALGAWLAAPDLPFFK